MERRFPRTREHMLTAVDMAASDTDAETYNPELVARLIRPRRQAIAKWIPSSCFAADRSCEPLLRPFG